MAGFQKQKCIRANPIGITLLSVEGQAVFKQLPSLFFTDYHRNKLGHQLGQGMRHSLLGLDILSQFSIVILKRDGVSRRAFLTTDTQKLETLLNANGYHDALMLA